MAKRPNWWKVWGWFWVVVSIIVLGTVGGYGIYRLVEDLSAEAVPSIAEEVEEPAQADVEMAAPEEELEEVEAEEAETIEIPLVAGAKVSIEPGLAIVGDVEVRATSEDPWTPLYDDKAETGLIVIFDEPGFVHAPWGATKTNIPVEELEEAMKSGGCVGGCEVVVVVHYPVGIVEAAEPEREPTPEPGKWVLSDPPGPEGLPDLLHEMIVYRQPPANCADDNDPQLTCSTREGQPTSGNFVLAPGEDILMTGDAITITESGESRALAPRPTGNGVHDLWLLVNLADDDWELRMNAPHGSFRGYYTTAGGWTPELVAYLRDLHLNLFNLPVQTYDRFMPTPVPNCGSADGCDFVDVRLGVRFSDELVQWFNGHWGEHTSPHWVPDRD